MKSVKTYLESAIKAGASDLHLVGGEAPAVRVQGDLQDLEAGTLSAKELETAVMSMLEAEQKKRFQETLVILLDIFHNL